MSVHDGLFREVHRGRAMGSHQCAATGQDEWLTPPHVIDALGPFDLDPCAPRLRPWDTAAHHYTADDNGLRQEWSGLVWLNPPYSTAAQWLARLAGHPGGGVALLFARTETTLWHRWVWPHTTGVLFLRGRLHFHHVDGRRASANAGAPSALIAYGLVAADRLAGCGLPGQLAHAAREAAGHVGVADQRRR